MTGLPIESNSMRKGPMIIGKFQTKCVIVRSHQGLFWGPSKFSFPLLWDFFELNSLQWIFCWLLLPTNSCLWQKFLHPTLHQIVGTFALFSSCVKTILKANIYCTFFWWFKNSLENRLPTAIHFYNSWKK